MKQKGKFNSDDWCTPDDMYNILNDEFKSTFDPCPLNADFDGLSIEWGESNFVNPPYSRNLKERFIRKALEESRKGSEIDKEYYGQIVERMERLDKG